jgi:hypothetical protein
LLDGTLEFLLLQHPTRPAPPPAASLFRTSLTTSHANRMIIESGWTKYGGANSPRRRHTPRGTRTVDTETMRGRRRLRPAARRSGSTAGVRPGDSSPADADASGSAAQAAAARCEAVRRNCCNDPEARFRRGASGRAPDNPDSNTAPSNRADIAFVCLANPRPRRRGGERLPPKRPDSKAPKLAGLCACGSSESRRIYTISCGAVAKLWKTVSGDFSG